MDGGWAVAYEKGMWEQEPSGCVQMNTVGVGNEWSGLNTSS